MDDYIEVEFSGEVQPVSAWPFFNIENPRDNVWRFYQNSWTLFDDRINAELEVIQFTGKISKMKIFSNMIK